MIAVLVSFILFFLGNSYLTPAFVAGLFGARCSGGGLFISFARGNALAILGSPALLYFFIFFYFFLFFKFLFVVDFVIH